MHRVHVYKYWLTACGTGGSAGFEAEQCRDEVMVGCKYEGGGPEET